MKENKTDVIKFRVSDSERAQIQALADRRTNGNISSLIKNLLYAAMREEEERSMKLETRYELKMATAEVSTRREIVDGCCGDNPDPTTVATFRTKEEALDALKAYKSTARHYDGFHKPYWFVTEYWVEENVYRIDEDGDSEFYEYTGVWGWSQWDQDYSIEEE